MSRKSSSILSVVSTVVSIAVGTLILAEGACDRYVKTAYAAEKFKAYDQIHRDTAEMIHTLALTVERIDERTRVCE